MFKLPKLGIIVFLVITLTLLALSCFGYKAPGIGDFIKRCIDTFKGWIRLDSNDEVPAEAKINGGDTFVASRINIATADRVLSACRSTGR